MKGRRALAAILGALTVAALAVYLLVRDGGQQTSVPTSAPATTSHREPKPPKRSPQTVPWPAYGFDPARTHVAPYAGLRPPFRTLWQRYGDGSLIEFTPTVAYGRLYAGTHHGLVFALDARTGAYVWRRHFGRCVASSTAVAHGVVYVTLMGPPPCRGDTGGLVVALDARTGRTRWRLRTAVTESSPLVVGRTLYFGAWDGRVYAVDLRSHRVRWSFETGDKVKAGAAFAAGAVYVGSYDGRLYAIDARTGRLRWSTAIGRTYATPAVAGGRVYVSTVDGEVVAADVRDGHVLWSRQTGGFVYAAAAVWRGTAYVGSYDHHLYALSARTGAVRWNVPTNAPVSGSPTVLGGLVYFSTCGSCSSYESNPRARRTYAVDARTGALRWRFPDGEYTPVAADGSRVYLTGAWSIYGLAPR